jgi:glucosamine-6-phosphate deaminase
VRTALEGEVSAQVTASFLQEHDNAIFVLDHAAAGALTRYRTPWQLGPLEEQGLGWDERMTRRAILWLSQHSKKAILKLTDDDYNEAGLQDLLRSHGSAYEANRAGFYQLQHTITGWPGGRDPQRTQPGDALVRPLRAPSAAIYPKRVLVLSPHPDDDVISMGGTLCRLVDQGHEVHIAYEVSGAGAVADEAVWRALAFIRDSAVADQKAVSQATSVCSALESGAPLPDGAELSEWKALIRRHEAVSAARVCGVPAERLRFLDLPFYNAGSPRNRKTGPRDVEIVHRLLTEIRPHLIYAAGDLDDPHGTHRMCLRVLREALAGATSEPWLRETELWLYRGAWAEWDLDEIDLAVPLSPQEVLRRRRAIFRHETQKDQALFLGTDQREFWQRTEDRSRHLAQAYNALGLAEYEAIEAFKRWAPGDFVRQAKL